MDPGGSRTGAGCCKADNANHNRYPISVLSSMLLGYWLEGWSLPSVQVIPSHPPRKVKTRRKGQGCKGGQNRNWQGGCGTGGSRGASTCHTPFFLFRKKKFLCKWNYLYMSKVTPLQSRRLTEVQWNLNSLWLLKSPNIPPPPPMDAVHSFWMELK